MKVDVGPEQVVEQATTVPLASGQAQSRLTWKNGRVRFGKVLRRCGGQDREHAGDAGICHGDLGAGPQHVIDGHALVDRKTQIDHGQQ